MEVVSEVELQTTQHELQEYNQYAGHRIENPTFQDVCNTTANFVLHKISQQPTPRVLIGALFVVSLLMFLRSLWKKT